MTVGDLRQLMHNRQPPQPAVEAPPVAHVPPPPPPEPKKIEVPTYKNPPLNPVSPGGGMHNWSNLFQRKNVTFQGYPAQRNHRNITSQNADLFQFKW